MYIDECALYLFNRKDICRNEFPGGPWEICKFETTSIFDLLKIFLDTWIDRTTGYSSWKLTDTLLDEDLSFIRLFWEELAVSSISWLWRRILPIWSVSFSSLKICKIVFVLRNYFTIKFSIKIDLLFENSILGSWQMRYEGCKLMTF